MGREIECKLRIDSPEVISDKLRALGAEFEGENLEQNWVLDTAEGTLRQGECLLRVRSDDRARVTYKGPSLSGEFKQREEIECEVESAETFIQIFSRLGFQKKWFYEKYRATWRLPDCEVVIDRVPDLGNFIEIEAESESVIADRLHELGLDRANHIKKSYLALYADYCKDQGEPLRDMKF